MNKSSKNFLSIIPFIIVSVFPSNHLMADSFLPILHEPNELIAAVYEAAELKREEAKVIIFEYDYIKARWHIEITPTAFSCIDCYPSFYIENKPLITVVSIPHG
ncbi:hypothetical protein NBRC116492_07020 [Aurantivibrio infirmus]